jgi:excisionase family DNA binding protein
MKQQHASVAKASDVDKQQHDDHGTVVPLVVSPKQACQLLSIGTTRLYELLASGALASYHEGRARRISMASIVAHVNRQLAAAAVGEIAFPTGPAVGRHGGGGR